VRDLQKQCDEQAAENGRLEEFLKKSKSLADSIGNDKNEFQAKLKERRSLIEKWGREMADAKKITEADYGDIEAQGAEAEKEADLIMLSAAKVQEEVEKIQRQRDAAKTASQEKIAKLEQMIKDIEMKANSLSPACDKSFDTVQHLQNDCLKKKTSFA